MSHQTTGAEGETFAVSEVAPAAEHLAEVDYKDAVELLIDGTVEACSQLHGQLVADVGFHPLVAAADLAFRGHRPLSFSPDMIWLLLCQGLASHVNANPEQYRDLFVQFEGKQKITVRRDDFVKGSPENPWSEVFGEFTRAIRSFVGDKYDMHIQEFSTTGSHEKAAFEVALMDTVQSYFDYELHTLCGIPSVTLEGTTADWKKLRAQAALLAGLDLQWWIPHVLPLLDQFIEASSGQINRVFWQSLYKLRNESGGPYVTGWLVNFFPYLRDHSGASLRRSEFLIDMRELDSAINQIAREEAAQGRFIGLKNPELPSGLSRAPVLWEYFCESYEMEFYGGFVGVRQDPQTMALRPEIGWAVRDVNAEANLRAKRMQVAREEGEKSGRLWAAQKKARDILSNGGSLEIVIDNDRRTVRSAEDIPGDLFQVARVDLAGSSDVTRHTLYEIFERTEWENLEELRLSSTSTSNYGVADLVKVLRSSPIHTLWLDGTNVTDGVVKAVTQLPHLAELHLERTQVSADGIKTLRRSLRNCQVFPDSPSGMKGNLHHLGEAMKSVFNCFKLKNPKR